MPPLTKLKLEEIAAMVPEWVKFYFHSYKDDQLTFYCCIDNSLFYNISFFPSPFTDLTEHPTITDIIAAIDTARLFSLSMEL